MVDVPISALTAAGSLDGTETLYCVQSGASRKVALNKAIAAPAPITATGGTAGRTLADRASDLQIPSIAALCSLNGTGMPSSQPFQVQGYYTPGDGGDGWFWYNAASSATPNGGTIIAPADNVGRFLRIYRGTVYARWFGVYADFTHDDTAALNAGLAVVAGTNGTFVLPVGTCLVTAGATTAALFIGSHMSIVGAGNGLSTIKVKGTNGPYYSIFRVTADAALTGFSMSDFTIDSNIANNSIVNTAEITAHPRFELYVSGVATNCRVQRMEMINSSSQTATAFYNEANANLNISANVFTGYGDDPNHVYHDTSVIYTCGIGVTIQDNKFTAAGIVAPAGITAIETHSRQTAVHGNIIINFQIGMNITGSSQYDTTGVLVTHNSITGCIDGIQLWSNIDTGAGHTSGYGLDGLLIANNIIRINQASFPQSTIHIGIGFQNQSNMNVRNIIIKANVITFDQETTTFAHSQYSCGIGWHTSLGSGFPSIWGMQIEGNTILNCPLSPIKIVAIDMMDVRIVGNVIAGNFQPTPGSTALNYQYPIFAAAADVIQGLTIAENTIHDMATTSVMRYGIYLSRATTVSTPKGVVIRPHVQIATGTTTTSVLGFITGYNGFVVPYIDGTFDSFVAANHPGTVGVGSKVRDLVNVSFWTFEGGVWLSERVFASSFNWTPGLIGAGSSVSTTVATPGAQLGDAVTASWSLSLAGIVMTAYVSSTGNVTVLMNNTSGSGYTPAAGTVYIRGRS